MADVTCPECGTVTELPAVRRAADEFCRHCDYPLFWIPSAAPVMANGDNEASTLRRLPGAGGRAELGARECPACGELNLRGATHCIRCSADLDPKPPEPLPPPPAPPPPEPEPEPVVVEHRALWPWWLLAVLLATAFFVVALIIEN